MLRDIRKNKIFSRRALVLASAQGFLGASLILRLGYLQIFKHKEFSVKSDSNSVKPIIKPAARGNIFDRNGIVLTENRKNFRLLLYINSKRNSHEIIEKIAEILELDAEKKQILIEKLKNSRRKRVISLIENLDYRDLARIETFSHKLDGVAIESGYLRRYLFPNETAHFLGYVSLPSENEIDENQQALFLHPDFRIGKSGIEKSFDETLRGKYGVKYVEVDVRENPIKTLSSKEDIDGLNINLTIDLKLQKFVTKKIENIVASVVVMHVETGEILAYASSPSFDGNEFVEGISQKYWQELMNNSKKPLSNKPISALYPPGSPFKLMTIIAALENGVNPERKVFCSGKYQLGRRTFHCWKEEGHGNVDMSGAIKHSCNTYFYTIANQIGNKKILEVASRFGYGQKADISLYGSKAGLVPSNEWVEKYFKRPWQGGDTLNIAIGQGSLLATPLQMALVCARIANGGVPIKPYLVKNHNTSKQFSDLKSAALTKESYIKIVQEGMNRVINEAGGTAYGSKIYKKGFEMAGKTGTAQVISKREKEMSAYEKANLANHGLFIGFAPVSNPKYAISVVVEHGGSGSASAAPVARDIMTFLQNLG
jgi:penicillin-binding protein 2